MTYHRYTVTNLEQTKESVTVYWRLGLAASFLASAGGYAVHALHSFAPALNLAGIPVSTALIYIALAEWTSSSLWQKKWSRALLGIKTPKISGRWDAVVSKSRMQLASIEHGHFVIEQKWRTMSVGMRTENGTSESTSAALIVGGGHVRLEYQYHVRRFNRPNNDAVPHQGAAFIDIPTESPETATNITLSYFTEDGEIGVIHLTRVAEQLSHGSA